MFFMPSCINIYSNKIKTQVQLRNYINKHHKTRHLFKINA
ncbi:hypothetical protein PMAN_a2020 [Pseudoalteromonas marina]|nr:hypothetical protein PMAN_a2020 [Pseudoalteromonas marina]